MWWTRQKRHHPSINLTSGQPPRQMNCCRIGVARVFTAATANRRLRWVLLWGSPGGLWAVSEAQLGALGQSSSLDRRLRPCFRESKQLYAVGREQSATHARDQNSVDFSSHDCPNRHRHNHNVNSSDSDLILIFFPLPFYYHARTEWLFSSFY